MKAVLPQSGHHKLVILFFNITSGVSFWILGNFLIKYISFFALIWAWNLMPGPVIPIQSRSEQFSNYRDEKIQRATLGWWKWVDRGEKSERDWNRVNNLADRWRQLQWNKPGRRAKTSASKFSFHIWNMNWKLTLSGLDVLRRLRDPRAETMEGKKWLKYQ